MKSWIAGFVLAGGLFFLNDRFCFESIVVISSSMNPTILANERIFLNKLDKTISRNDVIVIDSNALRHRIIKRVVGLPGECVRLENSYRVLINDKPISVEAVSNRAPLQLFEGQHHFINLVLNPHFFYPTRFGDTNLCLADNQYYVLGDNRLASGDSRDIGPVTRAEIQGKVSRVWYSFDLKRGGLRLDRIGRMIR